MKVETLEDLERYLKAEGLGVYRLGRPTIWDEGVTHDRQWICVLGAGSSRYEGRGADMLAAIVSAIVSYERVKRG